MGLTASIVIAPARQCQRYQGTVLGVGAAEALDGVHKTSAAALSLARGLNDAPKLAALIVGLSLWWTADRAILLVAVAMLVGGLLAARRVADTMARHITEMNAGSATTANLTASGLVILASFLGLPVSTTHVSCGALFGIGLAQRKANWRVIGSILLAWVTTLPLAAGLAFGITWAVKILPGL